MIYFCADDYGISPQCNNCVDDCLKYGTLNKVSVLPNGQISEYKKLLSSGAEISLHINLVEGRPLSNPKDVDLIINDSGCFKYSFGGLFLLSFFAKRKKYEKQVYKEIKTQIRLWKECIGDKTPVSLDSHQHTYMIPWIFKILIQVIKDEDIDVKYLRIPEEPVSPYIFTPSLYREYCLKGIAKQWILKTLAFVNRNEFKKLKIEPAYFMGAMFSGQLSEERLIKLLPQYLRLAEKKGRNIEIGFHPGCSQNVESLLDGSKESFHKFYFSPWRNIEYDTLINFKF